MVRFILTSKKAQVWGMDLIVAVIIFLVGLIVAYVYAINFLNEAQENFDELFYDGNLISSLILSDGTPKNWVPTNVEIPGIISDNKINQTKLDNFYAFSQENYTGLRKLLGTKYEFYFNFTYIKISGIGTINGIGKPIENPKNLVRIERFTIYENKPTKFTLFMWN